MAGPRARAAAAAARARGREHPRAARGSSAACSTARPRCTRRARRAALGRGGSRGSDEDAVAILPIPIDVERFAPEPDEAWLARLDAPVVGFVGRADDPRKNVGLLLRAFARVRAAAARGTAAPDRRRRRASRSAPASRRPASSPTSRRSLRECALLVSPARQEGFGIGVAEALACGVPAVVTPSGGPEEMVRRSGGGRVTAGFASDELADAMLDALGDRARLAELRRARARATSWPSTAPRASASFSTTRCAGSMADVAVVVGNYEGAAAPARLPREPRRADAAARPR